MEVLIVWVFFCLIVGWIADSSTLGFWGGFLLSLIFSPVIGFIVYLFYPSKKHRERQEEILRAVANNSSRGISAADEIEKLKALLDKGIISPDEYERQKAKLLS